MKRVFLLSILLSFFTFNLSAQVIKGSSQPVKLNFSKIQDGKIPKINIENISFQDFDNNGRLDAGETAVITFDLVNKGDGNARGLKLNIKERSSVSGFKISYDEVIGTLFADSSIKISISFQSTMKLETGMIKLDLHISEANGFSRYNKAPEQVQFSSLEFKSPDVQIVDHFFTLPDAEILKRGELVDLTVEVQNIGQGKATKVKLDFTVPNNILVVKGQDFFFETLNAGESKTCLIQFIANEEYEKSNIDISYNLTESFNKYGSSNIFSTPINIELNKTQSPTIIAGEPWMEKNIEYSQLTSSVDKNIPINKKKSNRYALIIGNEDYQSKQVGLSFEQNVDYALNDASIFKEYVSKTLGVPDENIYFLTDATVAQIQQRVEVVSKILKKEKDPEFIFYYAGHGYPDELSKKAYLIPVDVSAKNLDNAISLNYIYKKFSKTGAKSIIVFLDACFTGGGRTNGLLASRGIKIKPKEEIISGNMVVFSASQEDQSALPYHDEKHGVFTYFLLKKLQETKGQIKLGTLSDYLQEEISLQSLKINSKEQDPSVNVSSSVSNKWRNWTLY